MKTAATTSSRRRVRKAAVIALAALAIVFLAVPAGAAPGELDASFGPGGKLTTDFGPGSNSAAAVAIQPDGKIVAAGSSGSGRFALARYNSDGSLDTSFGSAGKVVTQIAGVFEAANAVAIQADGKIVAAGVTAPAGFCCQFALARYSSDGSLDPSFGVGGKVTTVFGGFAGAAAVAIQSDGKILAVGGQFDPFGSGFALARYNADGSLDASFGTSGKVITAFGGASARATGLVLQADGKIVAGGAGGPDSDFLLARYGADGNLDASFGSSGKVTTDFGGFDGANAVAIQSDGKIVAAGVGGFFARFALARYDADGNLDIGFGSAGKVTTTFFGESIESANGVALQHNGKIVAAGRAFSQFDSSYALARYNADGSLDATFGSGGKVTTDFGDPSDVGVLCPPARKDCSEDSAADVAIQPDGRIVAVGGGGACTPACLWTLARYLGDPTTIAAEIDVMPGSSVNPITLASRGLIPVAIFTSDEIDATTIDTNTVCFGDEGNPGERDCTESHGRGHFEDVNRDGRPDLLLHYDVLETGIDAGDTRACLTGTTSAGMDIEGCDSIVTTASVRLNGLIVVDAWTGSSQDIAVFDLGSGNVTYLTRTPNFSEHEPRWSPDGTKIVYVRRVQEYPVTPEGQADIWVMNADGTDKTQLTDNVLDEMLPSFTSDGKIVFGRCVKTARGCDVWSMNADGTGQHPLTDLDGFQGYPAPSPAGNKIAYQDCGFDPCQIFVMKSDGSGIRQVTSGLTHNVHPDWALTGNEILFAQWSFQADLAVIRSNGTGERKLTDTPDLVEHFGQWSPEGAHIVYTDNVGGANNIFVLDVVTGQSQQVLAPAPPREYSFGYPDWQPVKRSG